ncbi:hypothetical protein TNCT_384941 [Trichonephila clavata]|uniref:Uncharacterized protein n=1 Tax=Trichonephila clavata TaxID=2740835 RepID=A0A8X6JK03_TRICU|nr:hypothetical protein TNCT_384941 [Trichonephila clavata]
MCCSESAHIERPRWSCFMSYGGSLSAYSSFVKTDKRRGKAEAIFPFIFIGQKSHAKGQSDEAIFSDIPAYSSSLGLSFTDVKDKMQTQVYR